MKKAVPVYYVVSEDLKYYIGGRGSTYRVCCSIECMSLEDSIPPQTYTNIKTAEDIAKSWNERVILEEGTNKRLNIKFKAIPGKIIYEL